MRAILPAVMLMAFQVAFAQTKTVTGRVTDAKDGSPVSGASVVAKGTNTGGTTNADGSFSVSVPANAKTLVITSVGYGNLEVAIPASNKVNASLSATTQSMTDVVVVGYGVPVV